MKGFKYISIILIILIFITACSSNNYADNERVEQLKNDATENYIPTEGGTLVLSTTRFKTLNPIFNRNEDLFQIHHLIYESLVTFDKNMKIKPLLAETWVFNKGDQSIDFNIRKGVKWHDGESLTADDIVFTFNTIKGNIKDVNQISTYRGSVENITNITKINSNSVRVTFSKEAGSILEAMTFPILPEHVFAGEKVNLLNQDDLIIPGTGKYKLEEYENMRNISLIKNDNYWGSKEPYIDNIDVLLVPDEEAQLSLFENGEIDVVDTQVTDWGKHVDEKIVKTSEFITTSYEFLGINFRKSILSDLNIRKAISYSIDREKIISDIYLDHATVADFPIMPNSWLYDDSKIKLGFNFSRASQLLDEAGYTLKNDNEFRTNEKGEVLKLKLIVNSTNILRQQTANFLKNSLKEVGIQLEVEAFEWEDFKEKMTTNNYDLILSGWNLSYIPNITNLFHSSKINNGNFIAYNNEELDLLLDSYLSSENLTTKKEKFSEIEEHIVNELPYISLFFRNSALLCNKKVKGDINPESYNIFANIEEWYINFED